MDLFYSGLTLEQQLRKLSKEVKNGLNVKSNADKGTRFEVTRGWKNKSGNCMMFLLPHVTKSGFMASKGERFMVGLIAERKMTNVCVSYCYLAKTDSVTKRMIKEQTKHIETLVSIMNPKVIVLMGSDSCYSFMPRKPKIEEHHGTVVDVYQEIPLLLTYHPEYYVTYDAYEDKRYKDKIMDLDWTVIDMMYKQRIT